MRLRKPLALGIAMLLTPVALLAADPATEPAATSAATATSATTSAVAPATAVPAATEANAPAPVGLDKPKGLDQCDMATGSIIRPKMKDGCKSTGSLPTRTYTKEDIERTGEFDLNEALRKLDPSFR